MWGIAFFLPYKEVEVPEEDKPFNLLDTMSPAQLIGYNKRIGGEKDDRPDWVKLDWDPKRNAALDQGRNQLMPGFRRDPTGKYVNDVLGWEGTTLQDYWRKWDEIEAGRAEWQKRFPNWWQSNPWRPDRTDEERGAKFDPKEWYPDEGEKKGPKKDLQDRLEALLYGEGTDQTYGDLTGQQQSGAAIGNLQGAMHMYEGPNGGGDLGDFNAILRSFDVPPWTEEQFLGRYPDAVVDMDAVADAWYLEGDIAGAHWNPDDLDKDGDVDSDDEILAQAQADTGEADTGEADTGEADTGEADTGVADTGEADTGGDDTEESAATGVAATGTHLGTGHDTSHPPSGTLLTEEVVKYIVDTQGLDGLERGSGLTMPQIYELYALGDFDWAHSRKIPAWLQPDLTNIYGGADKYKALIEKYKDDASMSSNLERVGTAVSAPDVIRYFNRTHNEFHSLWHHGGVDADHIENITQGNLPGFTYNSEGHVILTNDTTIDHGYNHHRKVVHSISPSGGVVEHHQLDVEEDIRPHHEALTGAGVQPKALLAEVGETSLPEA